MNLGMSKMKVTLRLSIVVMLFINVMACSSMGSLNDPEYQPAIPEMPEAKAQVDGGLFYASTNLYIFEDIKATRIGDLLTVVLTEATNASKEYELEADKESSIDFPNPTIFGNDDITVQGKQVLNSSATASRSVEGEGELTQENSLEGNITVTVTQVLPNGYLVIKGEKLLTLNEGSEVVRISGIVRPTDVDSNNMVESTKIANAHITYTGNGVVSNSSKPGWLTRFFMTALWPL